MNDAIACFLIIAIYAFSFYWARGCLLWLCGVIPKALAWGLVAFAFAIDGRAPREITNALRPVRDKVHGSWKFIFSWHMAFALILILVSVAIMLFLERTSFSLAMAVITLTILALFVCLLGLALLAIDAIRPIDPLRQVVHILPCSSCPSPSLPDLEAPFKPPRLILIGSA